MNDLNVNSPVLWGSVFLLLGLLTLARAIRHRKNYGWRDFAGELARLITGRFKTPLERREAPSFLLPIVLLILAVIVFAAK